MCLSGNKLHKPIAAQRKPTAKHSPEALARALTARRKIRSLPYFTSAAGPKTAHWSLMRTVCLRATAYLMKMQGSAFQRSRFSATDVAWSFFGALIGMLALALLNTALWGRTEQGLLIGSMGASTMLIFSAPGAPFAQPRNVIGGHIVSALMGVLVQSLLPEAPWFASSLAVALAIAAMQVTATQHPAAAASALIAVVGSPELKALGWVYAFYPVAISAAVLVAVGILMNNLSRKRVYPVYWW